MNMKKRVKSLETQMNAVQRAVELLLEESQEKVRKERDNARTRAAQSKKAWERIQAKIEELYPIT